MQLTPDQIKKFVELHSPYGGLGNYTEEQLHALAHGVANYLIILAKIYERHLAGKDDHGQ